MNLDPLYIEHRVARIISDQSERGVPFDLQKARFLVHSLTEKILELDRLAIPQLPLMVEEGGEFKSPFKKNGQLQLYVQKYAAECYPGFAYQIRGPFCRINFKPFDMGKTEAIKDVLFDSGWIPDEWNWKKADASKVDQYIEGLISSKSLNLRLDVIRYAGPRNTKNLKDFLLAIKKWPMSPKITEDSFDTVSGTVPLLLSKRLTYSHRRSMVKGLIEQVRSDGTVPAQANPCGTPTCRMKHKVVVNIPSSSAIYGPQCRSLFTGKTVDGIFWPMVGYDASGLELRMLAHAINDEGFTRVLLEGDPHTKNQKDAGLETRAQAKTFIYAFIYGAGDAKIGSIVGGTSSEGAAIRERFLAANPGLAKAIEEAQAQAKKGYVLGVDGRKLIMRRDERGKPMLHKALNTYLQGAGAIVMKYAMVILDDWVKQKGLRAYKVIDMHDEGQWICHPDDVKDLEFLMLNCVSSAGVYLKLNVPLASEVKIGSNWSHTH